MIIKNLQRIGFEEIFKNLKQSQTHRKAKVYYKLIFLLEVSISGEVAALIPHHFWILSSVFPTEKNIVLHLCNYQQQEINSDKATIN